MKIVNYNPKELEDWRILQQDGELVREHQNTRHRKVCSVCIKVLFAVMIAFVIATGITVCFLDQFAKELLIMMAVLAGVCFVAIVVCVGLYVSKPISSTGYQPERTFREWFHARASKYKIIAIDRLSKTGNSRLEIAFEKEDGSVLKCISPYVTVIETTRRTENTLDVSAGVLYIAYGVNREPVELVIPQEERIRSVDRKLSR